MALQLQPIGFFYSPQQKKYMAARQAALSVVEQGTISLLPHHNFEQALADLEGFDRIWLLFWFHENSTWKPKVQTPRVGGKRSLFATRSPHRPNPIGLSCVELLKIEGRELTIGKSDLIDGTPILDIKPYLPYADSFPESRIGWLENITEQPLYTVEWSQKAESQLQFLETKGLEHFREHIALRLSENPLPFPNHRIVEIGEGRYQLALQTWRINYLIQEQRVLIESISSGYDAATTESRWGDLDLHREFMQLP